MTNHDVVLTALVQAAIEKVPSIATAGKRPITSSEFGDISAVFVGHQISNNAPGSFSQALD